MRRAKIVCTLGPATSTKERIRDLVDAGMNVARMNLSHGSYDEHEAVYRMVREASEEAMQKGPFGYPVVDVGVTLVDGTFHSVDSSDMAFRTATRLGVAEALAKAEPVLLEPINHVTVSVPNQFTPGVQRLLSGRRGQILGYAERPGWTGWDDVEALVPEAELHDFILQLRSDTMGLGSYRKSFDHLAEARGKLAAKGTEKEKAASH